MGILNSIFGKNINPKEVANDLIKIAFDKHDVTERHYIKQNLKLTDEQLENILFEQAIVNLVVAYVWLEYACFNKSIREEELNSICVAVGVGLTEIFNEKDLVEQVQEKILVYTKCYQEDLQELLATQGKGIKPYIRTTIKMTDYASINRNSDKEDDFILLLVYLATNISEKMKEMRKDLDKKGIKTVKPRF